MVADVEISRSGDSTVVISACPNCKFVISAACFGDEESVAIQQYEECPYCKVKFKHGRENDNSSHWL